MGLDGINSKSNDNLNLPNKLDLSQFNQATKMILNVFDTDKEKGFLSKQEIQKALFELNGELDVTGKVNYNYPEGLYDDLESISTNGKKPSDYINEARQALLKALKLK